MANVNDDQQQIIQRLHETEADPTCVPTSTVTSSTLSKSSDIDDHARVSIGNQSETPSPATATQPQNLFNASPLVGLKQSLQHDAPTSAKPKAALAAAPLPNQIDALILDQHLLSLLVPTCQTMLRRIIGWLSSSSHNNNSNPASAASNTLPSSTTIQAILSFITLLWTKGQTPAVKTLGLELVSTVKDEKHQTTRQRRYPTAHDGKSFQLKFHHRLIVYSFLSIVLPWVYDKLRLRWLLRIQQYQQEIRLLEEYETERYFEPVEEENEEMEPEEEEILWQQQRQQQSRDSIRRMERIGKQRQIKAMQYSIKIIDTIIPLSKLTVLLLSWLSYSNRNRQGGRRLQEERNSDNSSQHRTTSSQSWILCFSDWWDKAFDILSIQNIPPDLAMLLAGLRFTRQQQRQLAKSSAGSDGSSSGLSQVPASVTPPPLHVLYGHRRWLSDEVVRLGPLVVVPLLNVLQETRNLLSSWWWLFVPPIRRRISKAMQKNLPKSIRYRLSKRPTQPKGCPVCRMDPIGIPYQAKPCGHVYCYTCLWDLLQKQQLRGQRRQEHGSQSTEEESATGHCRVCNEIVTSCFPVTGTCAVGTIK